MAKLRHGREAVERRLQTGESLRSIAGSLGITYQTLQYHRRNWGCEPLRPARTSGSTHNSWHGGFFIDRWGYKMVLCPERGKCSKYVGEHTLVAERMIGRLLLKNEVAHHINGIKLDNREENLVVVTRSQHKKFHAQLEALAFQLVVSGQIRFSPTTGYGINPCAN